MNVENDDAPTAIRRSLAFAVGGNGFYLLVSFARNLLLAGWLGPVQFGTWNLGIVLLQYGQWLHGGLLNAFRLDGARARGAGDLTRFEAQRRLTWSACVYPSLTVCTLGLAVVPFFGDPEVRAALLMVAFTLVPLQVYQFTTSTLAVSERFDLSARVQVGYAVAALAGTVLVVYAWGFWGAVATQALSYVVVVWAMRGWLPRLGPWFDRALARTQFFIGLPVALNGLLFALFISIDRTLVAALLGVGALGQYSLTALARSTFGLLPVAISEVIYVRLSRTYGATGAAADLVPLSCRADLVVAWLSAPALVAAVSCVSLGVTWLLPEYIPGIAALEVFLLGLFFAFPVHAGVILTAIGRAADLTVMYAAAVVVESALVAALVARYDIVGAAAATGLTTAALFLAVTVRGLRVAGAPPSAVVKHVLLCCLPILLAWTLQAVLLDAFRRAGQGQISAVLLAPATLTAIWAGGAALVWRSPALIAWADPGQAQ